MLPEWCPYSTELSYSSLLCQGLGTFVDLRGVTTSRHPSHEDFLSQSARETVTLQALIVATSLQALASTSARHFEATDIYVVEDGVIVAIGLSPIEDSEEVLASLEDNSERVHMELSLNGCFELNPWEIPPVLDVDGAIDPILIGLCEHIVRSIPLHISIRPIMVEPFCDPTPVLIKSLGRALRRYYTFD